MSKDAPFVKPKHDNLRDEILESGFLTMSEWMECVDLKGRLYLKTERVRKLSSIICGSTNLTKEKK